MTSPKKAPKQNKELKTQIGSLEKELSELRFQYRSLLTNLDRASSAHPH
jgi:ribosomal protein L29